MKKLLVVVATVILFAMGMISSVPSSSTEIPDIVDDANRCRCKHGGCYGGNLVSLRPKCAVNLNGPINCREYDMNCYSGGEDDGNVDEGSEG